MHSFVFLLMSFMVMPVWASTVIKDFTGSSSAFVLKRGEQELTISRGKILRTGDEITVSEKESFIKLLVDDNRLITLTYQDTKNGPYKVVNRTINRRSRWYILTRWWNDNFWGGRG